MSIFEGKIHKQGNVLAYSSILQKLKINEGKSILSFIGKTQEMPIGLSFSTGVITAGTVSDLFFNYYYGKPVLVASSGNGIYEAGANKLDKITCNIPDKSRYFPRAFNKYSKSAKIKVGYSYCVKIDNGSFFAKVYVENLERKEEKGIHQRSDLILQWVFIKNDIT